MLFVSCAVSENILIENVRTSIKRFCSNEKLAVNKYRIFMYWKNNNTTTINYAYAMNVLFEYTTINWIILWINNDAIEQLYLWKSIIVVFFYDIMAKSPSGQDDENCVFWLATPLPTWHFPHWSRKKKYSFYGFLAIQ